MPNRRTGGRGRAPGNNSVQLPAIMFFFIADFVNLFQELLFIALLPSGVTRADVEMFLSSDGQSIVIEIYWPRVSAMMNPMQRWREAFPQDDIARNHHAMVSYMQQINHLMQQHGNTTRRERSGRRIRSVFTYRLGTRAEQPHPSNFQNHFSLMIDGDGHGAHFAVIRLHVMRTNVATAVPRESNVPTANRNEN